MVAYCASKAVKFGENEIDVTKNLIGIVVVMFDLLITFGFWCSMLAFRKLQDKIESEIDGDGVQPMDFSIAIYQDPHKESLQDLPGVYYAWIEHINSLEPEVLEDPITGETDEHQNNVWNIDLGLTNFGHLKFMKNIGKLLT